MEQILERLLTHPSISIAFKGDPGIGKTARVEAWAKSNKLHMEKLLLSSCDETDVAGIIISAGNDCAKTLSPEWFKRLCDAGGGVLFLDELNCARREVQDTVLTLVQSRTMPNGEQLPGRTYIIAAMNETAHVDAVELSPAMRSRFAWFLVSAEEDAYASYLHPAARKIFSKALSNGFKFDKTHCVLSEPICNPRTISNMLAWCDNSPELVTKYSKHFIGHAMSGFFDCVEVRSDKANKQFKGKIDDVMSIIQGGGVPL